MAFLFLTFWFCSYVVRYNGGVGSRDIGESGGVEEK